MKKIFILIIIFTTYVSYGQIILKPSNVQTQELQYFSSISGLDNTIAVAYSNKQSFTGIDDAPSNNYFSFHVPLQSGRIGLGMSLMNQSSFITQTTDWRVHYSYHLNLYHGIFSLGLNIGNRNTNYNTQKLQLKTTDDKSLQNLRFANNHFIWAFSSTYLDDKWKLSLSYGIETEHSFKLGFRGEYKIKMEKWMLIPSFSLFQDNHSTLYQMGVQALFLETYFIEVDYRIKPSIIFTVGTHINKLTEKLKQNISISYSYQNNVYALQFLNSHEISLFLGLKNPDSKRKFERHNKQVSPIYF